MLASLTVSILLSAGAIFALQTPASAAPNHQVPFRCGETVTAATWSGHNPANAVDFQKTGILGMPVLASAAGTVTVVGNTGNTSYGRWIEIDHGSGNRTRYAHLDSQRVSQGQRVAQGTVIGTAGATGGVTGPHLHYEQRQDGTAVRVVLNGVAVPYYAKTDFTSRNNCGDNPYTPQQVCGANYSVIDSAGLGTAGTVYLLYNPSNQYNCVVTLKSTSVGTPTAMSAFLTVQGSSRVTDSGSYSYYAGPVRRFAGNTCVQWGGSMGSTAYQSPFEHCG
jgi:murein DD-endopeptidase MepM/ murein hydrolase activator NlpD